MPQLAQIAGALSDPLLTQILGSNPVIEPLDGPTPVDDLMDRFPAEVYQQGRDTHLYKFLTAICGDAGAGLIKKQAYAARLQLEAEFLNFQVLDGLYANQFQLHRLPSEVPLVDLNTDAVTPTQADQASAANESYYHRCQEFFTATRYGNSPSGLAMVAQAGTGLQADLIEHYKYVFDQYSDLPLGLVPLGQTTSTSEFVIETRGDASTQYSNPWTWEFAFTAPTLNTTVGRPVQLESNLAVSKSYSATSTQSLDPALERNMIDLLDRLRPTSALATTLIQDNGFVSVAVNGDPFASSERLFVTRFVTGQPQVNWPTLDPSKGTFIQSGVETEATSFYGAGFELPVIFLTPETIFAYTNYALTDAAYGQSTFYLDGNLIPAIATYDSEHTGVFFQTLIQVFPFLAQVTTDTQFLAQNALAAQNTPLIQQGPAVG